jgi:hypothetical protein
MSDAADEFDPHHIRVPRPQIDWTIPVWGVIGLLGQAALVIWWGAGINARVAALEMASRANTDTPAIVARLDERTAAQSEALKRVEGELTQLSEDRRK